MNLLLSRKMRYFITLMETCCINAAAEKLCITRSPLGKILSELEGDIGSPLFKRKYNNLEPTSIAVRLYDRVKPLYESICKIESEFPCRNNKNVLELVFDCDVPESTFNFFSLKFDLLGLPIYCRRAQDYENISPKTLQIYSLYFTNSPWSYPDYIKEIDLGPEHLILASYNIPIEDSCATNTIPLLVKTNEIPAGMFNNALNAIKKQIPNSIIKECDMDLPQLLLQSKATSAALILPEYLFQFIKCPDLTKTYISGIAIHRKLYVNSKNKNHKFVSQIASELMVKDSSL